MSATDVVRRANKAWSDGNWGVVLEVFDRDVVWIDHSRPDSAAEGLEGMRRFYSTWVGTWSNWTVEYGDPVETGPGVYLVPHHERGRGKASGAEVEHEGVSLFWVENQRVVRIESFEDERSALARAKLG